MKWEKIPQIILTHFAMIIFLLLSTTAFHESYHIYQFDRDYNISPRETCFLGNNIRDGEPVYLVGWHIPDLNGQYLGKDIYELEREFEKKDNIATIIFFSVLLVIYNLLFVWMPIHRATQRLEEE